MFKSQDILLICIIIILIVVICHSKNIKSNNIEGFSDNEIFDNEIFNKNKLQSIGDEINNEKIKIEEIKGLFNKITDRSKNQEYIKDNNGTYVIAPTNTPTEDIITLNKLIDIDKLVNLNNILTKNVKNLPYDIYLDDTINEVIKKRITELNENIRNNDIKTQNENALLDELPIKNIKNINTSFMFDLERVGAIEDKNYKIKYKNDNNSNENNNINSTNCNNKCLEFDSVKFKDKSNDDYYSFEDCDTSNANQNLKIHNIKLEYKCYNNDNSIDEDLSKNLSECNKIISKTVKQDTDSYITKYNNLIKDNTLVSPIIESDIDNLPSDFVVITQKLSGQQNKENPYQCLSVDNENLTFKDCDLYKHQLFNYNKQ